MARQRRGPVEEIYRGEPAPVDLGSHPDARQFRTALSRGAAEGPNFARHYTVVTWGCGTMCQQLRIVDARTGQVYEGPISMLGVEYRLDSRLLVVNPPQAVRENPCPACETSYYVWNGEGLERVWPETARPAGTPPIAITARNGRRQLFADEVVDGELLWSHRFRDTVPALDAYVVERIYIPEGRMLMMVDAGTGEITEVDELPVPSPDGRRFITASLDLVAGHLPNRIRIYRVGATGPALEWEVEPREWGAREPVWLDARTIQLERGELEHATYQIRTSPMRLELREEGWRIQATPAPAAEARHALLTFFSALGERRYAEAIHLYGGSYELLEGWNPDIRAAEPLALWRAACERNGLQCFPRLEVLREEELSPGEYRFTLHFLTRDGRVWKLGPCCGETEESMPPVSEFSYIVRRTGERFVVLDLPPYMP